MKVFLFSNFIGSGNPGAASQVIAMVLSIGVLGAGFFGASLQAVMSREQNILRRFKVAPISPYANSRGGDGRQFGELLANVSVDPYPGSSCARHALAEGTAGSSLLHCPGSSGLRFARKCDRRRRELHAGSSDSDAAFLYADAVSRWRDHSRFRFYRLGCRRSRSFYRRHIS